MVITLSLDVIKSVMILQASFKTNSFLVGSSFLLFSCKKKLTASC